MGVRHLTTGSIRGLAAALLVLIACVALSCQRAAVHVASGQMVRCPRTHPLIHDSLAVATQEELDVNAVYVHFGRPLLKVIRQFVNPAEAREIVPRNRLERFATNATVFLVNNLHNVNLARCNWLCCSSQTGVLSPEHSEVAGEDCVRLAVEDGARCRLVQGEGDFIEGICRHQPNAILGVTEWVECEVTRL